jgi:Fic family protein
MEAIYAIEQRLEALEHRIEDLRSNGILSAETLKRYYGTKRFEQVAESNAIEGSTLSVRETELAITKGITLNEHNPQYIQDAKSLNNALIRLVDLANSDHPIDIPNVNEVHSLILAGHVGAGLFRSDPVRITGAKHVPPKTREMVTQQMNYWQSWSKQHTHLSPVIRSAILHAWLAHIHPYLDGNGRTARAIGNLELIKSGYPPILIKKVERVRYYDCLAESDQGNIGPFIELILDRSESSFIGLAQSVKSVNDSAAILSIKERQLMQLKIWNTAIHLLGQMLELELSQAIAEVGGSYWVKQFESDLDLEDYLELCQMRTIPMSWAFQAKVSIAGFKPCEVLAYVGHRSPAMYNRLGKLGGPSLFWSIENSGGFPKWVADKNHEIYGDEITSKNQNGDSWLVYLGEQLYKELSTGELAKEICQSILKKASSN